ncbi:MAG: glucose-6-phosphate isomerase, partial [Acinetobacter sp.]|nr:glucose-6-phosphate isomerase [Acinetobacter sp.]
MIGKIQPYSVENLSTVIDDLKALKNQFEAKHLTELFAEDPQRFLKFSVTLDPLVFDFSKHRVDEKIIQALVQWANTQDLAPWIKRLFSCEKINYTEQR